MITNPEPQSREEEILAATVNGEEYNVPPQSRLEYWLIKLKEVIEAGGSSSDYATAISLTLDSQTYVLTAQLLNKDGETIGEAQTIDLPLESTVVSGSYSALTKSLILTLVSGQTITIPISSLIEGLLKGTNVSGAGLTVALNYLELDNGQRVYFSSTAPTGTIPEGSLGVGW